MKILILTLFFLLNSFAVEFPVDLDQTPPEIDWRKIDTQHFEIIFPAEVQSQAKRAANLLEAAYPYVSKTLEVYPKKISLILHNQGTLSNAFVTLAPRRSEWFLSPAISPELTNTEWLKTLAIHEYRHVVQFEKSRQNFNRWYEILLGEIGQAVGLGLTLPPWYFEGDAVGIETALSQGGRGRLPIFDRDLRTLLLAGKKFSYDKAHLGSLNDYVPNHYVYGYFYTSLMRNKFGDYFLSHLANEATRESYYPLTFYNAFERLTNERFEDFYKNSMLELVRMWKEKQEKLKADPIEIKSNLKRDVWTNYLFPQPLGEKIIALKTGLGDIPQFVEIMDGKDKTIFFPGPLVNQYPYKIRNNRLVFNEWEIDPRWGMRDFSKVKVWDFNSNKIILEIPHTKSRLAILDKLGEKILAINWSPEQKQFIQVYNLNGKLEKNIEYPNDQIITSIDWLDDYKVVFVVKNLDDAKGVLKFDLETQENAVIVPFSNINYGAITVSEGEIFLESPQTGIDNIFHLSVNGLTQVTNSKTGAYAPFIKNGKLYYNNYSVDGMQVVEKLLPWQKTESSSDSFVSVYEKFSVSEDKLKFESDLKNENDYKIQDYSQIKNAVNLHSWVILAPPLSSTITLAGISRDVLNKFSLTFGGTYDLNQRESQAFISGRWAHLYPVFDLQTQFGRRRQIFKRAGKNFEDSWEEGSLEGGVQLPWKKIEGRYTALFTFRAFSKLIKVNQNSNPDPHEVNNGTLFSPGFELELSYLSRKAARDLNPFLGFSLGHRSEQGEDITENDQSGLLHSTDARIYLPGIIKHHSFFHQIAFEKQGLNSYHYASFISKPRGFESEFQQEQFKYSANYFFPLAYPDFNLSRYVYIRRFFGNFYYDQLNGRKISDFDYKASTGPELSAELFLFRLAMPLTLGVRKNFILVGNQKDSYEFFINTISTDF